MKKVFFAAFSGVFAAATVCAAPPTVLFREDFEKLTSPPAVQTQTSAGKFVIADTGKDSKHSLKAVKPDSCGLLSSGMGFEIPEASRGHFLQATADVRTENLGIDSDYFLMVVQSAKGKTNGVNLFLAYNDGLARQSAFGGQFKTPQTSGLWRQTRHQFQLRPDTDRVELRLVVRNGSQTIYFDNLAVEDVGAAALPERSPLVFSRVIDWPYAMIDLDDIVPGAVYRVSVEVSRPVPGAGATLTPDAQKSSLVAPAGLTGMGVVMTAYGLDGKPLAKIQLPPESADERGGAYRMVVPETAVRVELDLHNDDLIRFDHNQIEKNGRRFQEVKVELENYGEIAADNAFYQYIYRGKPDGLKVRNLMSLDTFDLECIKNNLNGRERANLEVVKHKGGMAFRLNGKLIPPLAVSYNLSQEAYRWYDQLAGAGIDVVFARVGYGGAAMSGTWLGEGRYDFSSLDRNIYNLLAQNPRAVVILSVDTLYPPFWWAEANQDELLRDQDGNFMWSTDGFFYKCRFGDFKTLRDAAVASASNPREMHIMRGAKLTGFFAPSLFSEKYRRAMNDYLQALRRYVESQPYGKIVAGYRMLSGYDGQWGLPHEQYDGTAKHVFDFSAPAAAGFRAFLKTRYGSDAALQKAWKKPDVTLVSATVPPLSERHFDQAQNQPYLLDPAEHRAAVDYRDFVTESLASLLISYGQTVKTAAPAPVLALAYYPDIVETNTGGGNSRRGNEMIYRSPWIDAVGGPTYDAREIGQPGRFNVLADSPVINGKIHLSEVDHRFFPVVRRNYSGNMVFDSPRKTISVLRREYMRQMCSGNGSWLFDMGFGWHNDPLITEIIKQNREVFQQVLDLDRGSIAKMAIFLGEYGKAVQADALRGMIPRRLTSNAILKAAQAGFPIGQFMLADLPQAAEQCKVFYFPFAYGLTETEAKTIEALKQNGNILVFGYGAGYVTGSRMGLQNVEALTGFKLGIQDNLNLTVRFTGKHPLTAGMEGQFFGSGGDVWMNRGIPGIYVDDPQAEPLALFDNTKLCGAAVKKHANWTGIYLGALESASPQLLQNIGRYAGLHIYSAPGDVMYFNQSLIGIHASAGGEKTIRLPARASVVSLWDGKAIGEQTVIVRQMELGENALYRISGE